MSIHINRLKKIRRMVQELTIKDIRRIFMVMRKSDNISMDYLFPKYGITCGE